MPQWSAADSRVKTGKGTQADEEILKSIQDNTNKSLVQAQDIKERNTRMEEKAKKIAKAKERAYYRRLQDEKSGVMRRQYIKKETLTPDELVAKTSARREKERKGLAARRAQQKEQKQ